MRAVTKLRWSLGCQPVTSAALWDVGRGFVYVFGGYRKWLREVLDFDPNIHKVRVVRNLEDDVWYPCAVFADHHDKLTS